MACLSSGETSGTTATFVIVDRWTVTVASVGDSRCILDAQGGAVSSLTVDHRLEENVEEYVSILKILCIPKYWAEVKSIVHYMQEEKGDCKWWGSWKA